MRLLFIDKNKTGILGWAACVLLPVSCLQKEEAGGDKPEGNKMVVSHREDTVIANDTTESIDDDGASVTGFCDPRTAWFLQNLHVGMDNAEEQAMCGSSGKGIYLQT